MSETLHLFIIFMVCCTAFQLYVITREITFHNNCPQRDENKYAVAKLRLNFIDVILDALLFYIMTFAGGLLFIHSILGQIGLESHLKELCLPIIIVLICSFTKRALMAYEQLSIDRRFKTGNISFARFIKETCIKASLIILISVPLSFIFTFVIDHQSTLTSSLWVWMIWTMFMLSRTWIYPSIIATLFISRAPLSDPNLLNLIGNLVRSANCHVNKIDVEHTSTRSTHANAKVSGMGNTKTIIFNDTLLKAINHHEVVAVMAHELGHAHHQHIPKYMICRSLFSLAMIIFAFEVYSMPVIQNGFNLLPDSASQQLAFTWLLTPILSILVKPMTSSLLRYFEFQADQFVINHDDPVALRTALQKLYRNNKSAVLSDPLFGFIHHSHPSLDQRMAWLGQKATTGGRKT